MEKVRVEDVLEPPFFEKRKSGVVVLCRDKVLLTKGYNSYWGIPKGRVELSDVSVRHCAQRELEEETGLVASLNDSDLYKIAAGNCYVFKVHVPATSTVDPENLRDLDSTGVGWVRLRCAPDFKLNLVTKQVLEKLS
jgi:8-oxo-dGTP pyrophosphatase MutT (NUDIX family)